MNQYRSFAADFVFIAGFYLFGCCFSGCDMDVSPRVIFRLSYGVFFGLTVLLGQYQSVFAQFSGGQFQPSRPLAPSGASISNQGFGSSSNFQPRTVNQTSFASAESAKINWIDGRNLEQAFRMAATQNKPVMLHFWNERCQPCMALEQYVFPNPILAQAINSQFIAVKVNTMQTPDVHRKYGVNRWPWDVFVSPSGAKLYERQSSQNVSEYTRTINSVAKMHRNFMDLAARSKSTNTPSNSLAGGTNNPNDPTSNYQASTAFQATNPATNSGIPNGRPMTAVMNQNQPSATAPPSTGSTANPNWGGAGQLSANQMKSVQANAGTMYPGSTGIISGTPSPTSSIEYRGQKGPTRVQNRYFKGESSATAPPELPPLGMEGFCPVSMLKETKKVHGSRDWGCVHRGKLYFFANQTYRDMFMKNPDQFAPALAGYDIVLYRETGKLVEGKTEFGGFVGPKGNRVVFLFSSAATKSKFINDKQGRYLETARVATRNAGENWLR